MSGPPTNSPSHELPAEQHPHDDSELDHEVRRGDHEDHRSREVRALAEERARHRQRRVRAGRRGCTEARSRPERSRAAAAAEPPRISERETNACTAPERPKPRMSAQRVIPNMKNASGTRAAMSSARTCKALRGGSLGGSRPRLAPRRKHSADEEHEQLDQRQRDPVQRHGAERLSRRGDREQQPVHRGLAHAEPRRREDEEDGDDRPDGGDPAEEDDRRPPRDGRRPSAASARARRRRSPRCRRRRRGAR